MNKHVLILLVGLLLTITHWQLQAQCSNPTLQLPDASTPVSGNPATAYCVTFTFDPDITGLPSGFSMQLQHTWQGDLSVFASACGNTLNIMQRPGVIGSCAGGCPCGNSNDIGTPGNPVTVTFSDGGGPDPENGIPVGGGSFGITADNSCPYGTPGINSFAALWASCPPGPISVQFCIADHAFSDVGVAADITPLFPNPPICGCTDPTASNYNPNATVDDGSCLPPCATFAVSANPPVVSVCQGESVTLSVDVVDGNFPTFFWSGTGNGTAYLDDPFSQNPTVTIPEGQTGSITYTVNVSDPPCSGIATVTVNILSPPTPIIVGVTEVCPGEVTTLTVTGGNFASISWSSGENTASIFAGPGDYDVVVTGPNGCPAMASVSVIELPAPFVDITGPDEVCPGGTIVLSATPGFAFYEWSSSDIGQQIQVFDPGVYTVTVTDFGGCTGTASFQVLPAPGPDVFIDGNLEFCEGGSTTLQGPPGMSQYLWSNNTNFPTTEVFSSGEYTLQVLDFNGCPGEATVTVTEVPAPTPTILGTTQFCEGETTILSVDENYNQYQWSISEFGPQIEVGVSGTYTVTVTDADGCTGEASIDIVVDPNPMPTITGPAGICPGDIVTLSAGAGYQAYDWSPAGGNISTYTADEPGGYNVTVTDGNGCIGVASFFLPAFPEPMPTITGQDEFCVGASATFTANAGFTSYNWSAPGGTSPSLTVSAAGVYTVTVTNAEECTGTADWIVTQNALPTVAISGPNQICPDATATLTATAGLASYQWSPQGSGSSISIDGPGVYSVTVTDANGCQNQTSYNVAPAPVPQPSILGDLFFCEGASTQLTGSPGFSSYTWSTLETTPTIEVTSPGVYDLIVTNSAGCSGAAQVTVVENPLPQVDITGNLIICPSGATVLQATPGFVSYQWTSGGNQATEQVNAPGPVDVTVVDANGCENTATTTVVEQAQLMPQIEGIPSFCTGTSTLLNVAGSFATYQWSTGSSGASTTVNMPGTVSVTVTDNFGCSGSASINVTALPLPQPTISGELDYCIGSATTLSGGASFQSYQWSTGSTTSTATVNMPGNVGLTVTDNNGCVGSTQVNVVQNPLPTPTISGIPGFCPGESTILTGNPGYSAYVWSTTANGASITVGATGNYQLTVTDANGCQGTTSIDVAEYAVMVPVISGELGFCPGETTVLNASAGFASYQWSTGAQTSQTQVTTPGNVGLTVTDSNGCPTETSATAFRYQVTPPVISGPAGFCTGSNALLTSGGGYVSYTWNTGATDSVLTANLGGAYTLDVVDANGCPSQSEYNLEEYPLPTPQIGGSLTYCIGNSTTLNAGATYASYLWSDGTQTSTVLVTSPGSVGLTVTDNNGCEGANSVMVNEATELTPVISGELDYCIGASTVLDAGSGYATYLWSDGSTGQTLTVNQPGVYTLQVADASGCAGQASVTVVENPLPQPQISGIPEFCVGEQTQLSAPQGFVNYLWNTGATTRNLTVNQPGNYTVRVRDNNGCENTTQVAVVERALPVFTIDGTGFFCAGSSTSLAVSPAFSAYQWSTSGTGQSINVSSPGTFAVTVTNEFGCESSLSRMVSRIALPTADAGATQILNCNILDVDLGGNTTSQGSQYTYEWVGPGITPANATVRSPNVAAPGTYTLVVTDQTYGCVSAPSVVMVNDLTNEPAVVLEVLDVLDCSTSSVVIDGGESATGPEIEYVWYNENFQPITGAAGNVLTVSTPSVFYLQVLDTVTGCASIDSVQVSESIAYPVAEAGPPARLDCAITSLSLDGSQSQQGPTISYYWSTAGGNILSGSNQPTPLVNAPGWYFLLVVDDFNGCQNIDSVLITQDIVRPTALVGGDQELNCLVTNLTLDGTGSSEGPLMTYQWLLNGQPAPNGNSLTLPITEPGTYQLVVRNTDNQCEARDEVVITRDDRQPSGLEFNVNVPTCFGDLDGGILVTGIQGGTPPFVFSLNGLPYQPGQNFRNLGAGDYRLTVQDATGCEYEASVTVPDGNDLWVELGDNQDVLLGDPVTVEAEVSIPASALTAIRWQTAANLLCGDCLVHDLDLTESTQFFITVVDENGCVASDLVTVFVRKDRSVYIPNAFSPNGDDRNDVLMVYAGPDVAKVNSLLVFNRWGEVLFEVYDFLPNDPLYGWNGTHRGELMNAGAYVWWTEVEFIDGVKELYKGDVILMR